MSLVRALDVGGAVGVDPGERRALAAGSVINRRGSADSDQLIAVPDGTGCRVSPRPAKGVGALAEAFGEPSRGKREVLSSGRGRCSWRRSQLDRIDAEPMRQVVHSGFEREHARWSSPGPRMNAAGLMSSGTVRYTERMFGARYRNFAAFISPSCLRKALYRDVSVRASCTMAAIRPERSAPMANRCRLVGRYPIPLYICLRVSTSLTGRRICARRERGEELMWPGGACAAERAADKRGDHTNVVDRDAERLGVRLARASDALHLVPHGETVAVPAGDGGGEFHGVVVVAFDAELQVGDDGCGPQRRVGVTAGVVGRLSALAPLGLRRIDIRQRRCVPVATSTSAAPCIAASDVVATTTRDGLTEGRHLPGIEGQLHAAEVGEHPQHVGVAQRGVRYRYARRCRGPPCCTPAAA